MKNSPATLRTWCFANPIQARVAGLLCVFYINEVGMLIGKEGGEAWWPAAHIAELLCSIGLLCLVPWVRTRFIMPPTWLKTWEGWWFWAAGMSVAVVVSIMICLRMVLKCVPGWDTDMVQRLPVINITLHLAAFLKVWGDLTKEYKRPVGPLAIVVALKAASVWAGQGGYDFAPLIEFTADPLILASFLLFVYGVWEQRIIALRRRIWRAITAPFKRILTRFRFA